MLSRVFVGLLVGVAAGALHAALSLDLTASEIAARFWASVRWGIVAGMSTSVAKLFQVEARLRKRWALKSEIATHFVFALLGACIALVGLLIYIGVGWLTGMSGLIGLNYEVHHRILIVMIPVLIGLLGVRSIGRAFGADIQSTETLGWSWNHAVPGLISGAVVGLGLGFLYAFRVSGLDSDWLAWSRVVVLMIVGLIVGGAFHGYIPTARPIASIPNQGIILSGKRSLIHGVVLGLIAGASWGVCIGIGEGDGMLGLRTFFYGFVAVYLIAGFWFGGLDVMRHTLLRVLLAFFGYLPLRLVPFLNFAETKLSFLKRDGGGYQFIHRYLQEHFASHCDTKILVPPKTTSKS